MPELYIGIMSGTSLDGIDAVLVNLASTPPRLLQSVHHKFDKSLREQLLQLTKTGSITLKELGEIDHLLGLSYVNIVKALLNSASVAASNVRGIGSHGQTIYHQPSADAPFTLQIGDANLIAEKTAITTVADFRSRDMAAGGQGAPLVPAFHNALFRDKNRETIVINIGGIANLSILPADPTQPVTGFDSGPGNLLLDSWIQLIRGFQYDNNGEWGATGKVIPSLLESLLSDPFFSIPAPKSIGRELFNMEWLQRYLGGDERNEDVQATLHELTARSISDAVKQHSKKVDQLILCGGGVFNRYLVERISYYLTECKITTTQEFGIDPQLIEAMAFAWLARETLAGRAGNIPEVTGARRAVTLGAIYPA
ncbi:MAG: anhydro-N-acetylmuramic acid kinase [Gammaproteobacteria bacterium]|nr:anhydro-N-acetylmuramic acid kinase [Gammaproteobacteria bacterium]